MLCSLWLLNYIVEHWFEVSVQNVRKLSAFEKTSLAETDCFVQYNFPYQKPDVEVDVDLSQGRCLLFQRITCITGPIAALFGMYKGV